MGAVLPDGEPFGQADKQQADERRTVAKLLEECKSQANSNTVAGFRNVTPILLLMAQVQRIQGLSLAAPLVAIWDLEAFYTAAAMVGIGLVSLVVFLGVPYSLLSLLKWGLSRLLQSGRRSSQGTQTDPAPRPKPVAFDSEAREERARRREEEKFAQEYVDRCTDLQSLLSERCREIRDLEHALIEARRENRALTSCLERVLAERHPPEIWVATSRGERYHLPNCGNIRHSTKVQRFSPCQQCLGA